MNEQQRDYKGLMTEVIAKQAVILGPDIAILKARNVSGMTVSDKGEVTDISGDPIELVQKLVDEYVALSGEIVRTALASVFDRYNDIIDVKTMNK